MTLAVLNKYAPRPDGFYDLDPIDEDHRYDLLVIARAALGRSGSALHEVREHVEHSDTVYSLTTADAADLNVLLDLPDQPVYDWTDVWDAADEDE